ncbi:F0F1 ATP synthase subunit I [Xenorhabdus bovienii]|uniref:ATP synthase protein I n=3 Tax=Xenorhabdus bovienii TaxID=40576 RepID=A0A0B6X3Y7_XENBV|nr:F0F1 ATP synthase subunit I [Xenorhabdus bovienii]MCG3463537.1 F0F1 ATP synthase subunit I [Xenorhabdus bovienii]CDG88670.1 membrane-bound ATP synthase subunit, F1-F0-type proton-ATPase [Xenorhabdus bovienii str. feltiae France]CDG92724.1 membrane-bound ATP synthase subunit, F1-F0-type proton-ATPase [Xenorhabdus bovienii str. feltiae Florida]CDG96359.1 membrane-bound ATP synthase subunit, F1-F0-type proton-ATPase [Xenorhabdus bovienii str. puntauvense]CDH00471.1 membrane-bound ATP synthase 
MSVSLYSGRIALKLLLLQLMTFVILSVAFCTRSIEWGASAFAGGLACWLPNAIFMLLTRFQKAKEEDVPVRIAWFFAIGEVAKVIITIAVLIVALGVFKAAFAPLGVAYLAVLIVQIIAPAVMNG